MAWWEYIPVVSTIGHAVADPPGRDVADYASCAVTATQCEQLGSLAAGRACETCISNKLSQYASDWVGSSIGSDFFEGVVGLSFTQVGASLLKKGAGAKLLGMSAGAWSGVGTALAGDALIDFGIQIKKLMDMYDAAQAAKGRYCNCP